jgi:hypothetical protein
MLRKISLLVLMVAFTSVLAFSATPSAEAKAGGGGVNVVTDGGSSEECIEWPKGDIECTEHVWSMREMITPSGNVHYTFEHEVHHALTDGKGQLVWETEYSFDVRILELQGKPERQIHREFTSFYDMDPSVTCTSLARYMVANGEVVFKDFTISCEPT